MNFLLKFKDIHGDKFDYSNIENKKDGKIEIICPSHGSFFQNPYKHISGQGCPECKRDKAMMSTNFIERSNILHNYKYDYSKVKYKGLKTPVSIICKSHGEFTQMPYLHLRGRGCKKCGIEKGGLSRRLDAYDFIKRSNIIHDNKYDYSLLNFKNTRSKVDIICKKHGKFTQNANSHLLGSGCPVCKSSKGENNIMNLLDKYNIIYNREHRFIDCKASYRLPFDFYLPEDNICIEYDGIQHFTSIEKWGGSERYNKQKINDRIKDKYCIENDIKLLRIPYTNFDSIKKILYYFFY